MVFLLASALFINYIDRGALPTAAPLAKLELHLDPRQLGWLFSAFFWTYSLMQIPVGWLAERFGAHRVLAMGLAIWGVATISIGLVHTFPMLFLLRLLLGIGESVGFPCVAKLIVAVVPAKNLGTANGVVAFFYLFGPAVGIYAGGLLMASYGWRSAFLVFGTVSLLWLVPWLRVKLPTIAVRRCDTDTPTLGRLLRTPAMWGTALGLFSSNYTFYFMLNWLPEYLVSVRGFSTVGMASIAGLSYFVNASSALLAGYVSDRMIKGGFSPNVVYKGTMAISHLGFVGCMLAMALGSPTAGLAALFVYQVLCGAQSPGVYAIPQILGGARATGRWVGIENSCGSLAGVVAPAATGFIVYSTHAFTAAFLLAAAVAIFGLIGWLWMLPTLKEIDWDGEAAARALALDARASVSRR